MADRPRLPFIATTTSRDYLANKDGRLINGFLEKDAMGQMWAYKRPGYSTLYSVGSGGGRGLYVGQGDVFHIINDTLYKNSASISAVTSFGSVYTFDETYYASKYFFKNDLKAYVYDGVSTVANVTDADYPAATVHGQAHLDGTLYVMDAACNIQGSAINNPTSWDPLNLIVARNEAGAGVAIAKILNLVVAMKEASLEFFYNAGNSTGSPLSRYEGPGTTVGLFSALTLQVAEDRVFFVGRSKAGGPMVMMLDKLNLVHIGTPAIDRLFRSQGAAGLRSWLIRASGHLLYGIRLSTPPSITIVYDTEEKTWYTWLGTDDLSWPIGGAAQGSAGLPILQSADDGKIFLFDPSLYQDSGNLFSWDLYTPNFDGGLRVGKVLERMDFVGDQVPGSILTVQYNDADYDPRSWSQPREVDLGFPAPRLMHEGRFVKRAYHFHHRSNTSLRLQACELDLLICSI